MFKFSRSSLKNMEGINSKLIEILKHAITISEVDFGVPSTGGLRDEMLQHTLFVNGKSNADGRYKKSKHQTGEAVDFFAYVDGKATWKEEYMHKVALAIFQSASILGYRVQWGGFFKSIDDLPHFELINEGDKC